MEDHCGETLDLSDRSRTNYGRVYLTRYNGHENYLNCNLTIKAEPQYGLVITFRSIRIYKSGLTCNKDWLEIWDAQDGMIGGKNI